MLSKEEAIYNAYIEIVPYTSKPIEVQVEYGKDEYGLFIRVCWEDKISSKIRYNEIQSLG